MRVDLCIENGTVWTDHGPIKADVLVDGDRIVGLTEWKAFTGTADRTVDAAGKAVLPGMVDVHVHTREPGYTHKEDIFTTTVQAAAGGVTTIFGMPNLQPATTTVETLEEVFSLYSQSSLVDWNHNPAATHVAEIPGMAAAGIRAFKIFMVVDTGRTYPHPASVGMHAHGDLLRVMDAVSETGLPLIVHPHDQSLMDYIEGSFHERGETGPPAYAQAYAAREGLIWDTACDVLIRLGEASGCPLHLAHMQTRRSVDAVRRAKERGIAITCEVNHWALFLATWDDVENLGPYALSYWVPDDAREAVWDGIRDGTIDLLSSDHAPHLREEKEIGWTQMWSAHTGTPGIQYQYPLLLDAVSAGHLTMEQAVRLVGSRPAEIFGLPTKGAIAIGKDADIVIADLDASWVITNEGVLSKCGWTPYDGRTCRGRIDRTFLRGVELFANGEVLGQAGFGQLVGASAREAVA